MPREQVTEKLDRRFITGEKATVANIFLKDGCIVPRHEHENEQFSCVQSGTLRFWLGADGSEIVDVRGGEVLHIPANLPHKAEAIGDVCVLDVFVPHRQDWLDKTDDYFRR